MVKVYLKSLTPVNTFIIKEGIIEIYIIKEKYRGLRTFWVSNVVLGGSVEITHLIHVLKEGYEKLKKNEWELLKGEKKNES
ncbi:MAG: hypothetical protein DRO40_06740 [Thermoprotei archaeon]|nr:MAG: hypothetical protein DRO40_06740 [Thermoprotei archaeon]